MIKLGQLDGLIDPNDFVCLGSNLLMVQARRYVEGMTQVAPLFKKTKGADCLTRFFKEQGVKQYMATSTPRSLIGAKLAPHDVMLRRLTHCQDMFSRFEGIVTGDDVAHGKPSPDIFLKASELSSIPPARCIVFEDSPLGIQGGLAAGMNAVAIHNTGISLSSFSGACQVLENLTQFDSTPFGLPKFVCDEQLFRFLVFVINRKCSSGYLE